MPTTDLHRHLHGIGQLRAEQYKISCTTSASQDHRRVHLREATSTTRRPVWTMTRRLLLLVIIGVPFWFLLRQQGIDTIAAARDASSDTTSSTRLLLCFITDTSLPRSTSPWTHRRQHTPAATQHRPHDGHTTTTPSDSITARHDAGIDRVHDTTPTTASTSSDG
jgi:hypothetical protein